MANVVDKINFSALIATLAHVGPYSVFWTTEPNPPVNDVDRILVELKLTSISSKLGTDEHLLEYNPPGYPPDTSIIQDLGNREVRIQVKVKVYDPSLEAAETMDLIRTGMRYQTTTAFLNGISLALEYIEGTVDLPTVAEDRAVSCCACDFMFGGIANQTSQVFLPGVGGDWIATVNSPAGSPAGAVVNQVPGTLNP